jgi:hypothetical protein
MNGTMNDSIVLVWPKLRDWALWCYFAEFAESEEDCVKQKICVINDLIGIVPESSVNIKSFGFDVPKAMDMKSSIFWG